MHKNIRVSPTKMDIKLDENKKCMRKEYPRARPNKEIDQKVFENLCEIQCTGKEICAALGVTDKTLNAWCKRTYKKSFKEVYEDMRQAGKASLRRVQWKQAQKNVKMSMWLGKQYLGQKDKPVEEQTMENVIKNIETLAEVVTRSAPNRNIEDLE